MNRILRNTGTRVGAIIRHNLDKSELAGTRKLSTTSGDESEKAKNPITTSEKAKEPIKFTLSEAYLKYRASDNFYGGDERDLPKSHNYVLTATGIFGFYYLLFLREDVESDGGKALFQPIHETVPKLAIPMIQAAIAENRRFGYSTVKLEKKLSELMEEELKQTQTRKKKLVEN